MRAASLVPGLLLPLCAACAAPAPAAGCTGAAALRELVWEQDCSGCPQGLQLRFGRDGRATFTVQGKARLGSAGFERTVPLAPADFDRLAAELAAAGLFGLAARHEDPGLADGRWTQWRATCTGGVHEVWRRDAAGPAALDALDAIVEAWRRRLFPAP